MNKLLRAKLKILKNFREGKVKFVSFGFTGGEIGKSFQPTTKEDKKSAELYNKAWDRYMMIKGYQTSWRH